MAARRRRRTNAALRHGRDGIGHVAWSIGLEDETVPVAVAAAQIALPGWARRGRSQDVPIADLLIAGGETMPQHDPRVPPHHRIALVTAACRAPPQCRLLITAEIAALEIAAHALAENEGKLICTDLGMLFAVAAGRPVTERVVDRSLARGQAIHIDGAAWCAHDTRVGQALETLAGRGFTGGFALYAFVSTRDLADRFSLAALDAWQASLALPNTPHLMTAFAGRRATSGVVVFRFAPNAS